MDLHQKIETPKAPLAKGPYSQAVKAGEFLFISGQIPVDLVTGEVVQGTIQVQTKLVLSYIEAILQSQGLSFKNIVKTEVYLKDLKDFQIMNQIYAEKFSFPIQPARQTFEVARLPFDVLIEISCIAYCK